MEFKTFGIIAGNSRVMTVGLAVTTQVQVSAFRAGLAAARARIESDAPAAVYVIMDCREPFEAFLVPGLSRNARRYPRLANLCAEARAPFAEIAGEWGFALDQVEIIPEDLARVRTASQIRKANPGPLITSRLLVESSQSDAGSVCGAGPCGIEPSGTRVTCAAVNIECFRSAARGHGWRESETLVDVFIEDDPWSRISSFLRGVTLAHATGYQFAVRLKHRQERNG